MPNSELLQAVRAMIRAEYRWRFLTGVSDATASGSFLAATQEVYYLASGEYDVAGAAQAIGRRGYYYNRTLNRNLRMARNKRLDKHA